MPIPGVFNRIKTVFKTFARLNCFTTWTDTSVLLAEGSLLLIHNPEAAGSKVCQVRGGNRDNLGIIIQISP